MVSRKKDKMTNNEPQNITQETKDRVTRTPLKTGGELRCSKKQYALPNIVSILYKTCVSNVDSAHYTFLE